MTAAATAPRFHHADPGTGERTWLLADAWDDLPVVAARDLLAGDDHLVVVVAHPDDETLGAGATLAVAGELGLPTTVLVATDGALGAPEGSPWRGPALAELRAEETRAALAELHPGALLVPRGLPDAHLTSVQDELVVAVEAVVRQALDVVAGRVLVLTTHDDDGHPDHAAAHAATVEALDRVDPRRARSALVTAPIWAWLWGSPDTLPWHRCVVLDVPNDARHARARAYEAHRSQTVGLGPEPQPLVGPQVRDRVDRVVETLVVEDRPGAREALLAGLAPVAAREERVARLESMFDAGDDPWGFEDSYYERRKRAVTLAAPARERLGRVLEIGCATGRLTADLVERADEVVAVDVSARALDVARRRGLPRVTWVEGFAPDVLAAPPVAGPGERRYDVVVLSEVGYFLTGSEWLATLRAVDRLLADDAEVVLCHWQHPVRDLPLDGPAVHAQARAALGLPGRTRFRDGDVLVEVLGGPESLARQEGRR